MASIPPLTPNLRPRRGLGAPKEGQRREGLVGGTAERRATRSQAVPCVPLLHCRPPRPLCEGLGRSALGDGQGLEWAPASETPRFSRCQAVQGFDMLGPTLQQVLHRRHASATVMWRSDGPL